MTEQPLLVTINTTRKTRNNAFQLQSYMLFTEGGIYLRYEYSGLKNVERVPCIK